MPSTTASRSIRPRLRPREVLVGQASILTLLVMAAILLAGCAEWELTPSEAGTRPPPARPTLSDDPSPTSGGDPGSTQQDPATTADPTSAEPSTTAAQTTAPRTTAEPATTRDAKLPNEPYATLSVESSPPGARVEVGPSRRFVGVTPLTTYVVAADIDGSAGPSRTPIRLELDGYQVIEDDVLGLRVGSDSLTLFEARLTEVTDEPPRLVVTSSPAGATVEVGLQSVNNVITPGTGRVVGQSPVTVELGSGDLLDGNGLIVMYRRSGCLDFITTIGGVDQTDLDAGRQIETHADMTC